MSAGVLLGPPGAAGATVPVVAMGAKAVVSLGAGAAVAAGAGGVVQPKIRPRKEPLPASLAAICTKRRRVTGAAIGVVRITSSMCSTSAPHRHVLDWRTSSILSGLIRGAAPLLSAPATLGPRQTR